MRSFGRVFRRGNAWYVRVRQAGRPEWVRRVAPAQGDDPTRDPGRKVAEQKLASIELDLARERHLGIRIIGRQSLADFLPTVERITQGQKPGSRRGTLSRLRIASARLTGPMSEVSTLQAQEFLLWLHQERHVSPMTRNLYRVALSTAWKAAVERSLAATNPWLEVRAAKVERVPPLRLTAEDVAAVAARAPAWARPIFGVLAETGLRRGEVLELEWRSVDLARRLLLVRTSKSGKPREVPLNGQALSILAGLERAPVPLGGPHLVFPGIRPCRLSAAFARAAKRCGFVGGRLHNLRASFITRALEGGAPLSVVRDLVGHSSVAVTNRYVSQASGAAMRAAVEGIERRTGGTRGGTSLSASS